MNKDCFPAFLENEEETWDSFFLVAVGEEEEQLEIGRIRGRSGRAVLGAWVGVEARRNTEVGFRAGGSEIEGEEALSVVLMLMLSVLR